MSEQGGFPIVRCLAAGAIGALMLCSVAVGSAVAQTGDYPNRPIRLVVGFAPGGNTDVVARLVAATVAKELGQPIVIENRPGAASQLASEMVARSAPDGYTLQAGTLTSHVLSIGLYKRLRFDIEKDFTHVALIARTPVVLGVSNAVNVTDLAEFTKVLKGPDKLNYASAGSGGIGHLAAVMFNNAVGADAVHVPYKGSSAALADLIDGRLHYFMDVPSTLAPLAADHKLRILAVAAEKRDPLLPSVPTFAEAGIPNLYLYTFNSWFAPAGTPPAIVARINAAVSKALQDPGLIASLAKVGNEAAKPMSAAELDSFLKQERDKWLPVLKASGITLD
ncbi:MAG: Bug family tripartite tricarboxylate transporter substrate binding protein [Lautropia sp.]